MTERPTLIQLSDEDRAVALQRFALLRPALEDGIPLAHLARSSGIPLRTAQRWVAQYRQLGLAGIARTHRRDRGTHRFPTELLELVEGLALRDRIECHQALKNQRHLILKMTAVGKSPLSRCLKKRPYMRRH